MHPSRTRSALVLAIGLCVAGVPSPAAAEGEPDGTFPTWKERWIHQLINRARCDPQVEMAACGNSCAGDAMCYSPTAPRLWDSNLNRAARFHSANLTSSGCGMQHQSPCTLVTNIGDVYPEPCDGAVSCACDPGTIVCGSTDTTSSATRISYFGANSRGENIAPALDPTATFYMWLYEQSSNSSCTYTSDKGHRWLILTGEGPVGIGASGDYCTCDFGSGSLQTRIPSGSHYPRQAASVEVWASWYDASGPAAAAVNVGGVCHPMSLERGTATNGAWMAEISGVGTGCHRYYFEFADSQGTVISYPTTGSLAIGSGTECPDWSASRPESCLAASAPIFTDDFESGGTSNWSTAVP